MSRYGVYMYIYIYLFIILEIKHGWLENALGMEVSIATSLICSPFTLPCLIIGG